MIGDTIPFNNKRMSPYEAGQRSATATKLGLEAVFQTRQGRTSVLEFAVWAVLTACLTAGMINGFWPSSYLGSCGSVDPYSGLPEELVANCTASPEDQKPAYCEQKYAGHIAHATQELQSALHSYSNTHANSIEMARREVVDFYKGHYAELDNKVVDQENVIKNMEMSLQKLQDQLTAKKLELSTANKEFTKVKQNSKKAETAAEDSKAKLAKFEQELYSTTQKLSATGAELANKTATLKDMQKSKVDMDKALARSEAALLKIEQEKMRLQGSGEATAAQLSDVSSQVKAAKKDVADITKAKESLQGELQRATEKQSKQLEEMAKLGEEVEALNAKVREGGQILAKVQSERDSKAAAIAELEKRVQGLNATVVAMTRDQSSTQDGLASKVEEVKGLKGRVTELEGKLKKQQDAWQAEQTNWDKEKRTLLAKLERARELFNGFLAHNSKVQQLLVKLQAYLKSEMTGIMTETDSIVSEAKSSGVEKLISDLKDELKL